jgi:hypothetical protein
VVGEKVVIDLQVEATTRQLFFAEKGCRRATKISCENSAATYTGVSRHHQLPRTVPPECFRCGLDITDQRERFAALIFASCSVASVDAFSM